ncbi:hypothetical protein TNCV_3280171 [Trichonephila clavipes]|nr:hypothetical protein TNCV_3280171 [Trichonephila clavipes]
MNLRRNRRQSDQLPDFERKHIVGFKEAGWLKAGPPIWLKRYGSCSVLATMDHGRDGLPSRMTSFTSDGINGNHSEMTGRRVLSLNADDMSVDSATGPIDERNTTITQVATGKEEFSDVNRDDEGESNHQKQELALGGKKIMGNNETIISQRRESFNFLTAYLLVLNENKIKDS